MQVVIDLRYIFPPLLNLFVFPFLASLNKPIPFAFFIYQSLSIQTFAFLLAGFFLILLFLFFSVELPITAHPIRLRARGFSLALFISLVAAIFVADPSLFCVAFLFIIITAPWHTKLFDLFTCFFRYFAFTLQSLPTIFITITQNHENPDPFPPQVVVEFHQLESVAIEGELESVVNEGELESVAIER